MSSSSFGKPILRTSGGVTLVGGGDVCAAALGAALAVAPHLVAADCGADVALALGHTPDMAIGDFDSISDAARAALGPDRLHRIAEQDSTDFDKALRNVAADFVIAVGFGGGRLDHTLAAFNVLVRHPDRRCVMLSDEDLVFLAPRDLCLALEPGTRFSLFPMGPVQAWGTGLRWPVDGLEFAPAALIGTSNEVSDRKVRVQFSAPAMLVILPARCLHAALAGLGLQP